ncbi:MAG: SCP2 sterol-binding domain-containing protein [Alphaproteobacteria bacterium]|jgi:predicted lipid carrier protein YhbT|nr:SCP2 sterol-binding domain-containing protein [Alphaproteobacteria bacterium]
MFPLARRALALLPLPLVRALVRGWTVAVAQGAPEVFARLGPGAGKRFLIEPTDAPFAFVLTPDPAGTALEAHRRPVPACAAWDARIAGPLSALLALVDGRADADAQFFRREVCVEGDVEAATCLRSALDDLEPSAAERIASLYGPPGRAALAGLRRWGEGA